MSLTTYKKKRSFNGTPEPSGGRGKTGSLIFVIQKHDASRLHYDFRLEMDGVLKSWAIPKGPSTDPAVKRLAMMVEDHPYDYKDFEGVIPKGNYGAGTVIVWDHGTYEPSQPASNKKEAEKLLLKELKAGSLKITLHGEKLKGEFALVHTKGLQENAWLLIKHKDEFAKKTDITKQDKSIVSGKTISKMATSSIADSKTTQVKAASPRTPKPRTKKATVPENVHAQKAAAPKALRTKFRNDLSSAPKSPFPKSISPMLTTMVDKPPDEKGWLYEIKWDGYRAIALLDHPKAELLSRNNKSFNEKFYPIYDALKRLGLRAILDGEIVVLKESGVSSFGALQNWRSEADGELVYYVFDILWLDGHNLMDLPLYRRREILHSVLPADGSIRESETFDTPPAKLLAAAAKMGLEGIIAKQADSRYLPCDRGHDWLKIKIHNRHEVVIGGFTKNDDSPKAFSALLVGIYSGGKLQYTGKIGTGFDAATQKEMMARFKPLITGKPPFTTTPDVNAPSRFRPNPPHARATWLKPKLVCEVSYTEMTTDGVMRHPSFEGMRDDKAAKDVHPEIAQPVEEIAVKPTAVVPRSNTRSTGKTTAKTRHSAVAAPADKTSPIRIRPGSGKNRQTLLNPSEASQVRKVNGHELKFSNLSKIFWPKEKYTKRDLLNYYYQAAPYILPYLKDRPQSLNRFPNGIQGASFYQKDVTNTAPEWVHQFPYHANGEDKNFLVVDDEASLLWMANLGAIEMNPWNSTIHHPDNPDWCIIDLDPAEKNTFDQVIQTARMTKQILDDLRTPGFPKTSGSTGMHIYIPMGAKYTYDECQLFGKLIATRVQKELPAFTSIERMTDKRKGKIYVDYLQNRPKATLAAPYAVRPKPGAPVSMPLHWEEVKKGLKMTDFTIHNSIDRIRSEGDLFKTVLGKGIDMEKILKKISP